MARLTNIISLSIPRNLLREAEKIAVKEQRTKSELFREALRRYLDEAEERIFRRALQVGAKKSGLRIRTENDIALIVDRFRR